MVDRNLIYVTAGSVDEARRIGRHLVSERLAACVNIFEGMQSFYWWEGAVQEDREVVLVAKTRSELVPRVVEGIRSMHSYECPCIVSIPIVGGHQPFLEWIDRETASGEGRTPAT